LSIFSRAAATISGGLRRKGSSGNLYAPGGVGGWTSLFQTGGRASGQVRMTELERLQSNVGVMHAAVNRIAEDISSLQIKVQTFQRKQGGSKWVDDDTHPLNNLLEHPFRGTDGASLRNVLQQHFSLLGRAALLVVDGTGGIPAELHILYPHRLDANPDPVNFISEYRYTSLSGQQQFFPVFETRPNPRGVGVLEVRIPDPMNPYAGNSSVQAGSNSITLDAEVRAYGRFYFANNAMPGAVLESDMPYPGVDVARALKESWNESYQGGYNAGKIAPLWGGLKLKSTAPAFKDLAFPEITKATRQDILAHFSVPGPILGYTDTGALGADTFKAAKMVYQSQALDPHRKRLQRMLNQIAQRWPNCRVTIESPVEDDLTAVEKRELEEYQAGILSRSEYRIRRGYEPDAQPEIWVMQRGAQVYHGLRPEDMAEPVAGEDPNAVPDPNAPPDTKTPEAKRELASRIRSIWAAEYQQAKAGAFREDLWAQLPDLAPHAALMRERAMQVAGGNLALCYEALKAESKTLATHGGSNGT
jgi:HK97 family phage portal protein